MSGLTIDILGIMSGSSLDGADLACIRFQCDRSNPGTIDGFEILDARTIPYEDDWLRDLPVSGTQAGRSLLERHARLGQWYGEKTLQFLAKTGLKPLLIALHGHTVFHDPLRHFSFQLGDGAQVAALTGISTIDQFRTQDMALGGQGAPFAPLVDDRLFPGFQAYLNLGGIANISIKKNGMLQAAYDLGPANQVMNALARRLGHNFDPDGTFSRQGTFLPDLFEALDQHPWYAKSPPKSLDNTYVQETFLSLIDSFPQSAQDKLHTFSRHLADRICREIHMAFPGERISCLLSGGGAHNGFLVELLRSSPGIHWELPEALIIDFKECLLMGLLGWYRWLGVPNNLPQTSGARKGVSGGAIHYGDIHPDPVWQP